MGEAVFSTGPTRTPGALDGPGSPNPAGPAPAGPVRLYRAGRRVFAETSSLAMDPQLRIFIGDMVRPYGLPLREDLLTTGSGHAYAQMAEALMRDTLPPGEPIDLLVLAFSIHDIRIGQSTAIYLSSVCAGDPLAFAICDQGNAAAFTGLRLIHEYARTGECRRALLLVVEQSALHYQPAPVPGPAAPIPDRHAAVALLLDAGPPDPGTVPARAATGLLGAGAAGTSPAGGELTAVRQYPDVDPAQVRDRLAAAIGELGPDVLVLAGPALAPVAGDLPGEVILGPAGQPYTGACWLLAEDSPQWINSGRPVLLADYDPALRYLSLSTFDSVTASAAGGAGGAGGAGAAGAAGGAGTGLARPGRPVR